MEETVARLKILAFSVRDEAANCQHLSLKTCNTAALTGRHRRVVFCDSDFRLESFPVACQPVHKLGPA